MRANIAMVLGVLFSAIEASAAVTEIYSCAQGVVRGKAVLMQDLDCTSVFPQSGVRIERGTLHLNGHTLVTSGTTAIDCDGNCTIVGPGTITGDGNGIAARKTVRVHDVDFSVSVGAIGAVGGKSKVVAKDVTITGGIVGIYSTGSARVGGSTITVPGGLGIVTSWPDSHVDGPCGKAALQVRNSTVTGSASVPCFLADGNCADITACRTRPRVWDSTCETSCQGGTGVPCTAWGVCSAD